MKTIFNTTLKAHLINLTSREDRLEKFKKSNIPLVWERFEATPADNFIESIPNKRMRGHAGCQDSHMRLLREIQKSGEEYSVVLEDDVFFCSVNFDLEELLKELSPDLLYFGGKKITTEPADHYLVEKALEVHQTHAYLVKSSFIQTLLLELDKGYDKVDVIFSSVLPQGNCYILKEPIAFQREGESSNINPSS